jgi:ribosomal protein RSM22 (predicted rRNA methylase)
VERLSDAYVGGEPRRGLSDEERLAYTAYYGPVGALKVVAVLDEIRARGWRPPAEMIRLIDLGGGPGTATLGVALAGVSDRIAATLIDRDERWDTAPLLGELIAANSVGVSRSRGDPFAASGPFDLAIAANFLVELDLGISELAERIREHAERALAPEGVWIAIEPATRATTRRLHALRDALIERGLAVWAPCFHQRPCPMLARPGGWCHESRSWRQPAYHQALDRLARLDKRSLQFSFLALGKRPLRASAGPLAARVVSTVQHEKGRTRFRTCDAAGQLLEWDLLRRSRGPSARRIASLERGERVVLPHDRGGRIGDEDDFAEVP